MNIIMFLLFGLLVGVVARFLTPGREKGGWGISMLIGVVGSFLGGMLGRVAGFYREGEPVGFLMAVIGAMLLLFGYHALRGRHAH